LKVDDVNIPDDLYYSREHEWARVEGEGVVRIGVTDYAQKMLHEIVFVNLPKEGVSVKQMEALGAVESVKAVSDVYSPVSGRVVAVNQELLNSPELINQDPYGKGWIALIQPDNLKDDLARLLTASQYADYVKRLLKEK